MTEKFNMKSLMLPSRQQNPQEDEWALFRIEFLSDVIANFETLGQYSRRHQIRLIEHGDSTTFSIISGDKAIAPEARIFIDDQKLKPIKIHLDDQSIIASMYVADFEEQMSSVDFRAHYSREMGTALAKTFDLNVARVAVQAAREKSFFEGGEGGTIIKGGKDVAINGELIKNTFFAAKEIFDHKKVPKTDRFCFVSPATYTAAAATTDLINKNWGGEGSLAEGRLGTVAGITLVSTINLPQGNQSADSDVLPRYRGDFSKTAFHFMHKDAVATVMLKGITTSIDWIPTYKATLLTARYRAGHGILCPEYAIEVTTEEPS